jgi:hypothetical protein
MKKQVLLTIALMAAGMAAWGQTINYTVHPESKATDRQMVANGTYLTTVENLDCWVTHSSKGAKEMEDDDNWQIVALDANLVPAKRIELRNTEDCKLLAATADGIHAGVLLVDSSHSKQTTVFKAAANLETMTLDSIGDTLASYTFDRKDRCMVWGAASANGQYLGMLTIIHYDKNNTYVATASLYDAQLNLQWSKEFATGSVDNIYVTDDGQIITFGNERINEVEQFNLCVLTSRDGNAYSTTANCERLKDMRIVTVVGNSVITAGIVAAPHTKAKNDIAGGVAILTFDLESRTYGEFNLRPFENEDVNVMLNKKTKKVQHYMEVPRVKMVACAPTSDGVVLAFCQNYISNFVNANGATSDSYVASGIHLMAINASGSIKWVRNLRRNDIQKNGNDMLYISLFTSGEDICLVKNEHRKYPDDYDIAKDVPEYEIEDKGNVVLYGITPEGNVKKAVMEKKVTHMLAASAIRPDGTIVLMGLRGNKSRMVELKIQ